MRRMTTSFSLFLAIFLLGCPSDPVGPPIITLTDTGKADSSDDTVESDSDTETDGADPEDGGPADGTTTECDPSLDDESQCDGKVDLQTCEIAECSDDGLCVAVEQPKCCESVDDCKIVDFPESKSVCLDLVCKKGVCQTELISNDCCLADADCVDLEESCCDTATCSEEGACIVETLTECCETSLDCDDGTDSTNDICGDACVTDGCLHKAPACSVDKVYSDKGFDDGTLQLMKVFDENPGDGVTWHISNKTSVSAPYSVRFGRDDCDFYYNGPTEDCVPTGAFPDQGTPMNARLETAAFGLDPGVGTFLGFWVRMAAKEGFPGQDGSPPVDIDYLRVIVAQGNAWDVVWKSTDAFGTDNTTKGGWEYQTLNLSGYQGSVKVIFEFISYAANNYLDPDGNPMEGVYLDDIRVQATCQDAYCNSVESACESDGNGCTSDTCTLYANGLGGVCAYQSSSIGADCQPCGQPGDCGSNPCYEYSCNEQICSVALKDECCSPYSAFPDFTDEGETSIEGFEEGAAQGWIVDDPYPADNVGWQVDPESPFKGEYALYFGDPNTQTYSAQDANGDGQPSVGTIWTPGFTIPAEEFRTQMLSFWLNMSTEYDGSAGPGEGEKYDRLTVYVERVITGEKVAAWDSSVTGNTTDGAYEQIGVDLTAFGGEYVRIGFGFDSGDAPGSSSGNDFGGIRIDQLAVNIICGSEPCLGGANCDDSDLCTTDSCNLGICQNEKENPLCCTETSDCDDSNDCTIELCIESECLIQYDETVIDDCCSEGAWVGGYVATFDEGLDGFEATSETPPVAWYNDQEDGYEGGGSAHFANPATGVYNVTAKASSGQLTSPPITVPPYSSGFSYAEFMLKMTTEWTTAEKFQNGFAYVDELTVRAQVDGQIFPDPLWTSHFTQNSTFGSWLKTRVDVTAFAGQEIQLVIEFNTYDSNNNIFAGPLVDNFSFGTTCQAPAKIDCIYGGDCAGNGDCELAFCQDDFQCSTKPKETPACCEPYTVEDISTNFDGETPEDGWTFNSCEPGFAVADASVSWQVATAANGAGIGPKSQPAFLYFGNGDDYGGAENKGSCGTALSPPVTLQADNPWTLNFWAYFDIEKDPSCDAAVAPWADRVEIKVVDEETGDETLLLSKKELLCNEYGNWYPHSFDLSEWAGKTIRLYASFTTWDNVENTGKGIAIDSIEFVKGCPAP
jgi:hypothetical protein